MLVLTRLLPIKVTLMIFVFICCLLVFTLIGLSSVWQHRGTRQDYYLASGRIKPWLVGLSAVATSNSGFMFTGWIGYAYGVGLSSIWILVGFFTGDVMASFLVHSRLRSATERTGEVSYAGVLSYWHGTRNGVLQRVIGGISLVFMMAYAGAQLVAGGKALHVLFEWPSWAGAVMGSVLVMLYCCAGGIRASIWTDAAQSAVMVMAMGLLLIVAVQFLGGTASAVAQMRQVDGFLDWFPTNTALLGLSGGVLFALSWLFAGLAVIGQPHIMVRFMTLKDSGKMLQARLWYYLWGFVFYCMALGVGLLSRIYFGDAGSFDPELALPTLALHLLPPALVGLMLAGIFAATMSTADSLILGCSAAITHDLLPHRIESTVLIKATTMAVTVGALLWALINSQSVFALVIMVWSGMGSAFAPLLVVLCLGGKPSQRVSVIAVCTGLSIALLWYYLGWHDVVYNGMMAILVGLTILLLGRKHSRTHVGGPTNKNRVQYEGTQ